MKNPSTLRIPFLESIPFIFIFLVTTCTSSIASSGHVRSACESTEAGHVVSTGEIYGNVTDKATGEALAFATIAVMKEGDQIAATTADVNGKYRIRAIDPDRLRVSSERQEKEAGRDDDRADNHTTDHVILFQCHGTFEESLRLDRRAFESF